MKLDEYEKKLIREAFNHPDGLVVVVGADYRGKDCAKRLINLGIFEHVSSNMSEIYRITLLARLHLKDILGEDK